MRFAQGHRSSRVTPGIQIQIFLSSRKAMAVTPHHVLFFLGSLVNLWVLSRFREPVHQSVFHGQVGSDCSLPARLSPWEVSVVPTQAGCSPTSFPGRGKHLSSDQSMPVRAPEARPQPGSPRSVFWQKLNRLAAVLEGPCWYLPGRESPAGKLPIQVNLLLHFNSTRT